ncbi:MAG TPA: nuclear transport factor 2 family protein [Thermoanaerobaculia bacterium]|jgi:ketosteroid isomerase-like protein|nr:nuclear transport factor 2 family protein [Thermoanaerobaculia bacterium]
MNTKQVGDKLVEFCRKGKNMEAIDKLYSKDVVSIEAQGSPEMPAEMRGIDKIRGKNQWWFENNEVHSTTVEGPFAHNDRFAVKFHYEMSPKSGPNKGKKTKMEEVGVYTVKDGKIVREEFFYNM